FRSNQDCMRECQITVDINNNTAKTVAHSKKRSKKIAQGCAFCKNNGEEERYYKGHTLKDSMGKITCPILKAYVCPICGANGEVAHTIKYCPQNTKADDEGIKSKLATFQESIKTDKFKQAMTSTDSSDPKAPPQTPVLTVACRMLRSPSHESVTTDLSLFSVSSIASEAAGGGTRAMRLVTFKSYSDAQLAARGPSPNPDSRALQSARPADIPEILWFEEENDLIRSCAALSSALGLQKSFSTSDISQLPSPEETPHQPPPRCAVSELALSSVQRSGYLLDHPRLDHASRSCSTWVAVGDVASTSQLPSPHGGHNAAAPPVSTPPAFTAADLIRSVNKKVRQNYIRRRLLTTYKALERLSQSEFNLDRLEVTAATAAATVNNTNNLPGGATTTVASVSVKQRANKNLPLTIRDVERERGKPLSKYERNMMIFNWLHTLDDSSFEGL
ncbi:hypothetical protein L9F63_026848, partial [Diploptera punctata]